jgi:hypothetical protein
MSDRVFTIGDKEFQLSKISAFKQFHIVRRVAPILADLLPAMKTVQKVSESKELTEDQKLDQFAEIATPLMNGLSKLSDADSELVLYGLLNAVEIKQSTGNWAFVAKGSMLMMQDLELPLLLQIAGRAFMYNLAGFFAGLPKKS